MTRPPAVAGSFYPADPDALVRTVDRLLAAVPRASAAPDSSVDIALVVPHAGYRFSGSTAAHSFARLRDGGAWVRRVVLAGPSHMVPLRGCAVPSPGAWASPLGPVSVDGEGCAELARAGYATVDDSPHAREHALEVQLPFLQRVLESDVRVLPIAVGVSTVEEVSRVIGAAFALAPSETVVLCSTDLSHYLDHATATDRDARTVEAVLALEPDRIGPADACGGYALRGLLAWARERGLVPELLHRCTSGDINGDWSRVVGYSAVAFARPAH